jgi:hypothetical protein
MPRNGSGTYSRTNGTATGATTWAQDEAALRKIRSDLHDTHDQDIADALTASIAKNGETTTTAVVPFAVGVRTNDGTAGAPGYAFITDADIGMYRIGADNLGFAVNGVKALDIGAANFAVTSKLTLTSGQIVFPAAQSASADANTLDDYEEGTFTPAVAFGGATTGLAYTTQNGRYTKIGRTVFFDIDLVLSNNGSATGSLAITGLPFTTAATYRTAVVMAVDNFSSAFTQHPPFVGRISAGGTAISVFYHSEAGSLTAVTDAETTDTLGIVCSGHFTV